MGSKKDWEPVGINPVKRKMKSLGRMGNKTELEKSGMKMENSLFKETLLKV